MANILHRAHFSADAAILVHAALDLTTDLLTSHYTLGNIYAVSAAEEGWFLQMQFLNVSELPHNPLFTCNFCRTGNGSFSLVSNFLVPSSCLCGRCWGSIITPCCAMSRPCRLSRGLSRPWGGNMPSSVSRSWSSGLRLNIGKTDYVFFHWLLWLWLSFSVQLLWVSLRKPSEYAVAFIL